MNPLYAVAVLLFAPSIPGTLIYEDIGCRPGYDVTKPNYTKLCPVKYDCLGLKKSPGNCFLRGKAYAVGDHVESRLTTPTCDLGCSCSNEKDKAKFKCAAVDCPEWSVDYPSAGCYRKYTLDDCCSVREMCSPYDNSTTCVYEGRLYKEGESFLPRGTCWRCVCQAGFRGKLEKPFCRRRTCNVQIKSQDKLQERCAPVYYKSKYRNDDPLCCPATWICSDGDEKIIGRPVSERKCVFGQRTVGAGQTLGKTVRASRGFLNVTCECRIPPLLTCLTHVV
ncbi:uncharacterized protein LOC132700156 isoform X2 [Cylas formicarius]|uniref:uncharacterized protein LOC132700156 isoform X2 n=1 Tax=Cylas formicarius TaxID=197179 RepID=UPI0029584499|nr:uncharacterized protein LOC132700156 isoform X2 [Cylas formicarius]